MKKVMVINDDPDFQYRMKVYLERQGYMAEVTDDDEKVFKKIETLKPDLIIIDLQKELDKAICERLQEQPSTRDIPLVLLIEHTMPENLACKPHAVVQKPFQPQEFIQTIKQLL